MLRKVYWDKTNGEVIMSVSWDQEPPEKTFDQDYDTYLALKQRVKDTIALTIYRDREYEQDFREANAVRMNPVTGEPEFSYPDPSNPEGPPVYHKPLSEEVEELKRADIENKQAIAELTMMIAAPMA